MYVGALLECQSSGGLWQSHQALSGLVTTRLPELTPDAGAPTEEASAAGEAR